MTVAIFVSVILWYLMPHLQDVLGKKTSVCILSELHRISDLLHRNSSFNPLPFINICPTVLVPSSSWSPCFPTYYSQSWPQSGSYPVVLRLRQGGNEECLLEWRTPFPSYFSNCRNLFETWYSKIMLDVHVFPSICLYYVAISPGHQLGVSHHCYRR